MHTTMFAPIVRRNKPRWLNTIGFMVAALLVGSAAMIAAQGTAESPPLQLSPVMKAELLVPPMFLHPSHAACRRGCSSNSKPSKNT
jgi:hypothetical protein